MWVDPEHGAEGTGPESDCRRSSERLRAEMPARLRYQLYSGPVEADALVRDVSSSGARIVCRQVLPLGSLVEMVIQGRTQTICTVAEVVRTRLLEENGMYEAGVRFREFRLKRAAAADEAATRTT